MNIGLIIALVAILLALVLGYNIMLQYKVKAETAKRQESARYVAIIDVTEELLGHAHHLPFSKELLICLNGRILDALENMCSLDPKSKLLAQRVENTKHQIQQLNDNYTEQDTTPFRVPNTDRQALMLLKLVKRLREIIRNEHNKGRFETQAYVVENARLEGLQVRINIENVIKRANDAIVKGQAGTAAQLLRKGIEVLNSKSDNYAIKAKSKLESMLSDLEKSRQERSADELHQLESRERADDLDAIFGEKKKW